MSRCSIRNFDVGAVWRRKSRGFLPAGARTTANGRRATANARCSHTPAESACECDIINWCEAQLPHFAVPRFIEFVDELPKTPTGKTQKNKLRQDALNAKTWDRLSPKARA
ncbi:AMP-binding enzyme [Paraburkholderia phenoliruptrix]|uniref:AMP-binding enzyme n=1 Tax=Paraburkholderia phenoliruptrix TaxID=252970 RepID=UPI0034CD979C